MLDIKLIRENPELVRANLAKRNNPECLKMLEDLIALDKDWRTNSTKLNDLRHERKQITIEIAKAKKDCQNADAHFAKAAEVDRKSHRPKAGIRAGSPNQNLPPNPTQSA
jgi:seryl-tRNA synthetase